VNMLSKTAVAIASTILAGSASADCTTDVTTLPEVQVTNDIAVATTWTCDNTYNLQNQIFVLPGASLTIEAGTVVATTPTPNGSGAIAVSTGAQIFVNGTCECPVIMTSTSDVATWVNGDPKTGTWREAANEWGNLTIMGAGYVSENATPGNVPTCDANNQAQMEGLLAAFPGDPKVQYGGGDDDDDSGSISYLSLRYGGRVLGLTNELNGLSLGGIGRGTDIHHVDIMNNVDDGIEVWGGCVNLKHFSIWNIGDDSLDIDQGYRGKIQFGLIVQGWSLDAAQGSGVGDNCIETDGAENSDWQPVTTTTMYNMTVVGQSISGDGGTAWRDNARVQYRQCLFTKLGERLVRFDNIDGDGAQGYGHNGTLDWPSTWTTPFDQVPAHPNDCPPGTYKAQSSGNLAEIKDSVFYDNNASNAYTEAEARGVVDLSQPFDQQPCDNVLEPPASPIVRIARGAPQIKGGLPVQQVTSLDPRAQNDATTSVGTAPNDGFFTPVGYRGAFSPTHNWLCSWTAADAFGFLQNTGGPTVYCTAKTSSAGCVATISTSCPDCQPVSGAGDYSVTASMVQGGKPGIMFFGVNGAAALPFVGGTLCMNPPLGRAPIQISGGSTPTSCDGSFVQNVNDGTVSPNLDQGPGTSNWCQFWYRDPNQPGMGSTDTALSNAVQLDFE